MPDTSRNPFGGLDLLSSSVVLLDDNFAIRYMNSAAENLLALSCKAVTGRRLDSVTGCPTALQKALDNASLHGWSHTGQGIELTRSDGLVLQLNCTVRSEERRV